MSVIRKIVLGVTALLALLVLAAVILVLLVNPNDYKQQIQQKAAEQGVDLVIAGDIGWAFFPRPGFSVSNLEAQVPTGKGKQAIKVGDLTLALHMGELLAGKMEVGHLTVSNASTALKNAKGEQQLLEGMDVELADINVDGEFFPLSITVHFSQTGLQADVQLTAEASVHLQTRQYALRQLQMSALVKGSALPAGEQTISLTFPEAEFDGNAGTLTVVDLVLQAAKLKLETQLAASNLQQAAVVKLEPLAITLDDTHVNGKLHVQTGNPANVLLDLKGDTLDLDRYLADAKAPGAEAPSTVQVNQASETQHSDKAAVIQASSGNEPLPLSKALALPGDYAIAFDRVVVNHLQLANVVAVVNIAGEKLMLNKMAADLYQGSLQVDGSLRVPAGASPQLAANVTASHVQLPVLLADLQQAPPKVAAGVLTLDAQLTSVPLTKAQLLASLSGQARFAVDGLVINELNVEQRVCEAAAKVDGKSLPDKVWPTQTAFKDTKVSAQISNGVAQLSPVVAKLDTLDLRGKGPVNLVASTVDLVLDLQLINDTAAANFCEVMNPDLAEITWPLRCEGNYITQSGKDLCGIDKGRLDDLVRQAAQKKLESKMDEKLKEKFGSEADKFKEGIRNLFH